MSTVPNNSTGPSLRCRFLGCAFLGCVIGPMLAGGWRLTAQQGVRDSEAPVLTLADALALAVRHNPEYRMALNLMELEGARDRAAWGAFLPSLNLNYGTGQALRREKSWVDFEGKPVENPNVRTVESSYANQSASLSVDLFGGGRRHALAEARSLARARRAAARRDLNRILAEVWRQFLIVQRWKAKLAVEEALLADREGDFERSQRLLGLSMIDRSDLLGAQLDLEEQRSTVTQSRAMVDKGRLALRAAVGDPSLSLPDLDGSSSEPFDPGCLDVDLLVERALRESPVVGEADALRSASQSALRARRASRWPTLALSSSVNRHAYELNRNALFELNPGGFSGVIGVNLSIPLFDRFRTTQAVADASVELRNAGETMRRAALLAEQRMRERHVDLTTAWAVFRERSRRREVASDRLRMVREAYELEARTIEDVRAAMRDEAVALRDEVDQRYDFALALLGLYEAAGIVASEAGLGAEAPPRTLRAWCQPRRPSDGVER